MISDVDGTLVTEDKLAAKEPKYPLAVGVCPSCALMQVLDTVPPEEVFHEDYTYYASFSSSWLEHSKKNVLKQIDRFTAIIAEHGPQAKPSMARL